MHTGIFKGNRKIRKMVVGVYGGYLWQGEEYIACNKVLDLLTFNVLETERNVKKNGRTYLLEPSAPGIAERCRSEIRDRNTSIALPSLPNMLVLRCSSPEFLFFTSS